MQIRKREQSHVDVLDPCWSTFYLHVPTRTYMKRTTTDIQLFRLQEKQILLCRELAASTIENVRCSSRSLFTGRSGSTLMLVRVNLLLLPAFRTVSPHPAPDTVSTNNRQQRTRTT